MRRFVVVLLALLLAVFVPAMPPASANGCITPAAGTSGDPFLIQNEANLECLRDNGAYYWHRGYHFKQTADLDLSARADWSNGIGDDSDTFNGTYDGNGFGIDALTLADDTMVGLFGVTEGATLHDITLTNVDVRGTGTAFPTISSYVGGLVGVTRSNTTITDSSVTGDVTAVGAEVGGLVGMAGAGTVIERTWASASISGTLGGSTCLGCGGLVGTTDFATGGLTITDSYATGDVTSGREAGGLVGLVVAPATIERSYATGDLDGVLGPIGGLVGAAVTDDTEVITISQSFATGAVTATDTGLPGSSATGGGLVGSGGNDSGSDSGLVIVDSYAAGQVTTACSGTCPAGGIVGSSQTNGAMPTTITRTYSVSDLQPGGSSPIGGGILGDDSTPGDAVVTASFWNPTDSGAGATAPYGTESTQSAMTTPSLYSSAGWSISDTAPAGTTWVSCPAHNSGFPVLQWYAAAQGWTCAPAPPPSPAPTYPPSAPQDVVAIAGDQSATVTWAAPASSGSFPVTNYQVSSSPSGGTCLTSSLTCEISGLSNGTEYTFTVRALNGAGWSGWSTPSDAVTPTPPPPPPSIVITGSRERVQGKPGVVIKGTSTLEMGAVLRPWLRFPGQTSYAQGSASILVDAEGAFTWSRRTGKKIYIYVATPDRSLRSNRIIID